MTVPVAPTLITITTEAIKKAGFTSTGSTQYATVLARAQSDWIEEVKWDIWTKCKKLTSLQKLNLQEVTKGKSIYSLPTDFASLISVSILDGDVTGTAQAGGATSITLAAADTCTSDWAIGREIVTTGGTGPNQINQITALDTTTKIATVAYTWETNPDATTTYRLIEYYYPLTENAIWDYDKEGVPQTRSRPSQYHVKGDNDNGEIVLLNTPDDSYSLRTRYYADLTRLDLASATDVTIVQIYRRFKNIFIQGVYAKCLQYNNDDRAPSEMSVYGNLLSVLEARETYGMDLSNLQMKVDD